MRLLAVSGSLRRDSHNSRLLRAAAQQLPPGVELELYDGLKQIPPFDEDDEATPGPEVLEWRDAIEAADAVLFATPEYNSSIPGQLKNALDWASRPAGKSSLRGKVVAIAGASPGAMGTVRSQMDLRRIVASMGGIVVPAPEVLVSLAPQKQDAAGRFTDEGTRKFLGKLLEELARWVARFPAG
jgi:chromate reductase, NAD(P)H dehydrogenase (quinone)